MSTLYRRGKTWYLRYTDPADGHMKWVSLKTKDKAKASAKRARLDALLIVGLPVEAPAPPVSTLADLEAKYIAWADLHHRASTKDSYLWALGKLKAVCNSIALGDIGIAHLDTVMARMKREARAAKTMNVCIKSLKAVFGIAVEQVWMPGPNPFSGARLMEEPARHVRWLDKAQVAAVLEAAKGHSRDMLLYFALGIHAGLRKAEIVQARWEWFDWDGKLIHVVGIDSDDDDNGWNPKGKRPRTIPFPEALQAILGEYRQAQGFVVAPDAAPGRDRYRFDPRKSFEAICVAAGVRWCTPKTLRHTFASQLVSAGVSLFKVSVWLGHADPKTTMIYAHLAPADKDIDRPYAPKT